MALNTIFISLCTQNEIMFYVCSIYRKVLLRVQCGLFCIYCTIYFFIFIHIIIESINLLSAFYTYFHIHFYTYYNTPHTKNIFFKTKFKEKNTKIIYIRCMSYCKQPLLDIQIAICIVCCTVWCD